MIPIITNGEMWDNNRAVEDLVRFLGIPQLRVLRILANSPNGVSDNQEISETTQSSSYTLGPLLTPLRRKKINGEPLIVPMGKDPDRGTRWKLNEKAIMSVGNLLILLNEMDID